MKNPPKIAIVGATGLVGRTMLQVLLQRIPNATISLYASHKSAGSPIVEGENKYTVQLLSTDNLSTEYDIALFSAGSNISRQYAPLFQQKGTIVIDNSSCWRQDSSVPLVVPQVNSQSLKNHKGIIANPNCTTIQCVVALNSLQKTFGIERIIYNSYQSASGAGANAIMQLQRQYGCYDNIIPHIDDFCEDGYTKEEHKMIFETQKIFEKNIATTATCVRVPIQYGHGVSINVQLSKKTSFEEIDQILKQDRNITYYNDNTYPTPKDAKGKDNVLVGRLRKDNTHDNCYNLWVVADNIRKGAATNAVEIAEILL
ncbi:MAG: aspartate-semialdehyde dehydrogenase [Firmicutes bacterium]|nr:aspartate-semialdehyde dehydrogenase [Bacillota bacterium]MCL1954003.1 aspartate-semialdehyde dehydrogenase [Bacillota bacterium]